MREIGRASSIVALLLITLAAEFLYAQTRSLQNLSAPQKFKIATGEGATFGFLVSQPGPIIITANWQGPALTLTLSGPVSQPITQTASGQAKLQHTVTPQEIAQSEVWKLSIQLASERAVGQSALSNPALIGKNNAATRRGMLEPKDEPIKPVLIDESNAASLIKRVQVVAQGTVDLQHPPGDLSHVTPLLNAAAEQQRARLQAFQAEAARRARPLFEARRAELAKLAADRNAARARKLEAKLGAQRPLVAPDAGQAQQPLDQPEPPSVSAGRQRAPVPNSQGGLRPPVRTAVLAVPGSSSLPTITSLSVSEGQVGDPRGPDAVWQRGDRVVITGSNFGAAPGEVHCVANPGMDLKATAVDSWSDTQIAIFLPAASGILAFDGQLYVQVGGKPSAPASFRFLPVIGRDTLALNFADAAVDFWGIQRKPDGSPLYWYDAVSGITFIRHDADGFAGHKGDDEWFLTTMLKNGCVADYIMFVGYSHPNFSESASFAPISSVDQYKCWGQACVTEARLGTDSPYFKVHWWNDALLVGGQDTLYGAAAVVRGPLGRCR